MVNFFRGVTAYFSAIGLIFSHRLWSYILIPGFISLILGGLLFTAAWSFSDEVGHFFATYYPFEFGKTYIDSGSWIIGLITLIFVSLILYKNLIMVIIAPFMSALSERVEAIKYNTGVNKTSSAVADMIRGLRLSMRMLFRELFFVAILLLCSLIPVVGIAATALIFLVEGYYAGFGNFDCTLERYYNVTESIDFTRKHRMLAVGNGLIFVLLLMIPIVGLFLAPALGTVAGTLVCLKEIKK